MCAALMSILPTFGHALAALLSGDEPPPVPAAGAPVLRRTAHASVRPGVPEAVARTGEVDGSRQTAGGKVIWCEQALPAAR